MDKVNRKPNVIEKKRNLVFVDVKKVEIVGIVKKVN